MNVEDIVLQETSERDYRGIVSGAESSISNIKKQLMTVQTLRAELAIKEQVIHRLNEAVNTLERREQLSSEYYKENKILIERSRHLESALENSKKELASLNRQFNQHAVQSDALKGEVEALVNELSDMRGRSDKQYRELSMTRAKLVANEEALHEVQREKHVLQLELKQAETAAIEVRNRAKVRDSNIEYDLETLKDRCSIAERSLLDCEARVDNQASLTREWISKHDSVSSWLSEKKSESEHWRRLYIEQEAVVDTLTGLTKGIRAHQAHEEENNRISVKQALDKSVELKRDLADLEAAISYVSTNAEQLVNSLSQTDTEKKSLDFNFSNSQLKEFCRSFESAFSLKLGSSVTELPKLASAIIKLYEMCSLGKEVQRKLVLELEKTSGSTESAANILQKMEAKYISMKSQVKEAKMVMQQQQAKFGELLNTISVLSGEKEKKNIMHEREKEDYRRGSNGQSSDVGSNRGSWTGTRAGEHSSTYPYSSVGHLGRDQREVFGSSLKEFKSEEDVKILHETLNFVETLAVNATELETRYEEVLAEKRLLKQMCAGYDKLKADISTLAANCLSDSSTAFILDVKQSPTYGPYHRGGSLGYDSSRVSDRHSVTFSGNLDNQRSSPYRALSVSKALMRPHGRRLTLRIVGIYVLAGLRLTRILCGVRSRPENSKRAQQSSGFKKLRMSQSVYEESLYRKFGYRVGSESPHPSLLEVIKAESTNSSVSFKHSPYRRQGEEGGGGEAYNNLMVVRETLRNMTDAVTGMRAKELLLFLAESRYGEQQKELLTALADAEKALRGKDSPNQSNTISDSLRVPLSNTLRQPVSDTARQPTVEFLSEFLRQPMSDSLRLKMSETSKAPESAVKASGSPDSVLRVLADHRTREYANNDHHPPVTHTHGSVKGYERRSAVAMEMDQCSASLSSTIMEEGDSVLGEIQRTLYTPAANRYLSRHHDFDKAYPTSTPSFLSTSFSSPARESAQALHSPGGTRVYSEQVLAGDERHVSVALRAYALSVAQDENAWQSPAVTGNSLTRSYPTPSLGRDTRASDLLPVNMFTEDEIVNMSQTTERTRI